MKREKSLKATIVGHWTCTVAVVITMCLSLGFASTTKAYQIIQSIDSKSVGDDINRLRLSKEVFRGERVMILPVQVRIERSLAEARERGYVTTLMNRRRYLPDIRSGNRSVRQFAERIAINAPIQGTAADLIKVAMIRIHRRLAEEKQRALLILQIHDELVFEVPERAMEDARSVVQEEMERVVDLVVPLKVELGVGKNWAEAH